MHKGPKISGGIAIFARNDVKSYFKHIPNKHDDLIWVKLKKEMSGEKNDLYICTSYISPSKGGEKDNDSLERVFDEVISFKKKGRVLIQGDLNARTGTESDFIERDKFDDEFGIIIENTPPARNSRDQGKLSERGKNLLSLCKANDVFIVNGRKIGDLFGSLTSFQWKGDGLVDYVIADYPTFRAIKNLWVGHFIPWLSDHCPISL